MQDVLVVLIDGILYTIRNELFRFLSTGFTKMKDLDRADDRELYTNVLEQFAKWLRGLQ